MTCQYHGSSPFNGRIRQIYYNGKLIRANEITTQQYNYNYTDTQAILCSDLMKDRSEDDIKQFISENLSAYDQV